MQGSVGRTGSPGQSVDPKSTGWIYVKEKIVEVIFQAEGGDRA